MEEPELSRRELLLIRRRENVVTMLACGLTPEGVIRKLGDEARMRGVKNPVKLNDIIRWITRYEWTEERLAELKGIINDSTDGADRTLVSAKAAELAIADHPHKEEHVDVLKKVNEHLKSLDGEEALNQIANIAKAYTHGEKVHGVQQQSATSAPVKKLHIHTGDIVKGDKRGDREEQPVEEAEVVS